MNRLTSRSLIIVLITIAGAVSAYQFTASSQVDESIEALLKRWVSGDPVVIISIDIVTPKVDADRCFVAVHRFPTMYKPTPSGATERLYAGIVKPGETVTVKVEIPGIPVKYSVDDATGKTRVEYYEPQEFFILVGCHKGGEQVFKLARTVEVYPESIAHREVVNVEQLATQINYYDQPAICSNASPQCGGEGSGQPTCDLAINGGTGQCITLVRGPYLYSIDGLAVSYGLSNGYSYPERSAVYLEHFVDYAWCPTGYCGSEDPQWDYAGKKLAPSIVNEEVPPA